MKAAHRLLASSCRPSAVCKRETVEKRGPDCSEEWCFSMWGDAESSDCLICQMFTSVICAVCFTHPTPAAGSRIHCWCCSLLTLCPPPALLTNQPFPGAAFIFTYRCSSRFFRGGIPAELGVPPYLGSHLNLQTSVDQLAFAEQYLFPQPYLYNFWRKAVLVNNCVRELSNFTCCNR